MVWKYRCWKCGSEGPEGETEPKIRRCQSKGSCETLAQIHEIKTGHNVEVIGG